MNQQLASRAGSAISWRIAQMAAVKLIFLVRVFVVGRLLGPGEFGVFAVALVALDFVLKITNFGMVPALVQRQDTERRHYDAAWTVGLLRAGLVGLVVFMAAPLIAELFKESRATDLIRVLALRPLLEAGASIRVAELTRQLRFRPLAWIQFTEAVVSTVLSVILVWPIGVWALVAGPLAGALAALIISYVVAPYRPRISLDTEALLPLLRYGRWIFASALVAPMATSLLQMAISRQLGVAELGLYFLACKLAFLPTEVASGVIGAVAFPVYASLQDNRPQATRTFQLMLIGMVAVLLPVALLLFVLAPTLVEHVLGARWQGTVTVIRVLVWVNVVGMVGDAIVPVLKGLGRPSRVTLLELVQYSLLIVLAWELAGRFGLVGAGVTWLLAVAASQILGMYFLRQLLPEAWVGLAPSVIAVVTASLLGAAAAWGLVQVNAGLAGLAVAIGGGGLITVGVLSALDRWLRLSLMHNVAQVFPNIRAVSRVVTGRPWAWLAIPGRGGAQ